MGRRRRNSSLNISTILKKAQRQGISIPELANLTNKLYAIAGEKAKRVSDDSRISVDLLLQKGIRLHPFRSQNGPIIIDPIEDLQLPLTPTLRSMREGPLVEDLSLPGHLEAPDEPSVAIPIDLPGPNEE